MNQPPRKNFADRDRFAPRRDPRLSLRRKTFKLDSVGGDDERFEIGFMEGVVREDPCNEDALILLGHAYTRLGDYEKGLDIDRRLVRLRPSDATAFYNLACSCVLTGKRDEAFSAMERAVILGYDDAEYMTGDPDLASVRDDPRFLRLLNRIRRRASAES